MADLLSIGRSGLTAARKSLETTGHNLANVNTEGYSRQRVQQTTNIPVVKDGVVSGTGNRLVGVNRITDVHVNRRLNTAITNRDFHKERADVLNQVEHIFSEVNGEGLNTVLNRFFNAFRELANQPENETIRSVVRDEAKLIVKDFRRIRGTLDEIARSIDRKLESEVVNINQTLHQLAKVNKQIQSMEASGDSAPDLLDQRELAVRTLSESLEVKAYQDNRGQFVVNAEGVGTLISGTEIQELIVAGRSQEESSNNMAGSMEIFFKNRPAYKISHKINGGRIAAMLRTRNQEIRKLQDEVDNIAFELTNAVNAIHRRGYVSRSIPEGPDRQPAQFDQLGPTTGINFFEAPVSRYNAANMIDLSGLVKENLSNIATGLEANKPADNRVALAVSKLQHEKMLDNGKATFEEKYLQSIGRVGLETGKANLDAEQSVGLHAQIEAIKERVSGVSVDEEAANMVRFQTAYQASAKVMQTADMMFQTVLGLKK